MFRRLRLKLEGSNYLRDVLWQASGNTMAQVVGVLGMPLLTRVYSPTDFAVQALFLQLVTLGTAVVTWRYEYFVQLPRARGDICALNQLVLMLGVAVVVVLSLLLWLYREPLATQMGNLALAQWVAFAPVTAVLVSWSVAAQNNAQRFNDFKTSGLSELAGKFVYVGAGIVGGVAHLGASGLIATTAFGAVAKAFFIILRRPVWMRSLLWARPYRVRRIFLQYKTLASSTVLAHVLTTSAIAAPQVALSRLYGSDVLGQFALVLATIYLPTSLLGGAIGQVYYQRGAQLHAQGKSFFELWRTTASKLILIGVPIYGLVALISPLAYPMVFGNQWDFAGKMGMWMALAAFGSFVSSPMDRTCLIVGAGSYSILWSIFRLLSTLLVIWLANHLHLDPVEFIVTLVSQMCLAYGIDFWIGRRFSQGRLGAFDPTGKMR